jgi:glutamine amidotransferase
MGNLRSVTKAFEKLGSHAEIVDDAERLALAEKAVLPGVGAFGDTVDGIRARGLERALGEFIASGKPYLGICMGYQALFEESQESAGRSGLGLFKGKVVKFRADCDHKVPHMGWNRMSIARGKERCPLLSGLEDGSYFYFVHSYYVVPDEARIVAGKTDYAGEFASMIWQDNCFAVQFHPEKSQANGLKILENFIKL